MRSEDILKKALGYLLGSTSVKYRFMQERTEEFNVRRMAKVLRDSRSGYYQFIKAKPSRGYQEDKRLLSQIKEIHVEEVGKLTVVHVFGPNAAPVNIPAKLLKLYQYNTR